MKVMLVGKAQCLVGTNLPALDVVKLPLIGKLSLIMLLDLASLMDKLGTASKSPLFQLYLGL